MNTDEIPSMTTIVAANIRNRRKRMGLTQAEFAERIGILPDSLCRIEKGAVAPKFNRLTSIATELGCSVPDLFRTDGEPASVKLNAIEDMLRPLPSDLQDELLILLTCAIKLTTKRCQ